MTGDYACGCVVYSVRERFVKVLIVNLIVGTDCFQTFLRIACESLSSCLYVCSKLHEYPHAYLRLCENQVVNCPGAEFRKMMKAEEMYGPDCL